MLVQYHIVSTMSTNKSLNCLHFRQEESKNMDFNALLAKLIILTKRNDISQTEIGKVVDIDRAGANKRAKRNSKFKPSEIEKIEEHFDIKLKDAHISTNSWEQIDNEQVLKNYESFGNRLAFLQDELGYLDKAMARIMGTDEKRYMRIKCGDEDATTEELARLASKVDLSLDWLIYGE